MAMAMPHRMKPTGEMFARIKTLAPGVQAYFESLEVEDRNVAMLARGEEPGAPHLCGLLACNTLSMQLKKPEADWDNIETRTAGQYEMEEILNREPGTAPPAHYERCNTTNNTEAIHAHIAASPNVGGGVFVDAMGPWVAEYGAVNAGSAFGGGKKLAREVARGCVPVPGGRYG
eukprot:COSAG04_NODE_3464_length_2794_cov_5.669759_3_plen_174_part_00